MFKEIQNGGQEVWPTPATLISMSLRGPMNLLRPVSRQYTKLIKSY